MWRYLSAALLLALCAALVAVVWFQRGNAALQAENASLARSMAVLEGERQQARLARDVARAEADRVRVRAAEYDALREALIDGGEDQVLPEWFKEYLKRLLERFP